MKAQLPPLFQLHVSLLRVTPRVWRRLLVPGDATLGELHEILQIALGWNNSHLHEFRIGTARYGMVGSAECDREVRDEDAAILVDVLAPRARFEYEYDFGDGWEHALVVEDTLPGLARMKPVCLDGARAGPPDDCGGPLRYTSIVAALRRPRSRIAREFIEWYGEGFDPDAFDAAAVNRGFR